MKNSSIARLFLVPLTWLYIIFLSVCLNYALLIPCGAVVWGIAAMAESCDEYSLCMIISFAFGILIVMIPGTLTLLFLNKLKPVQENTAALPGFWRKVILAVISFFPIVTVYVLYS